MNRGESIILTLMRAVVRARSAAYHCAPTEDRFVAWGRAQSELEAYERSVDVQDSLDGEPCPCVTGPCPRCESQSTVAET